MTIWAIKFGWNWLLLPAAIYLGRRFWLATREQPLKYLQHTRVTAPTPFLNVGELEKLETLVRDWIRHLNYPNAYPQTPEAIGSKCGLASYLLDVMRRERMFPWRRFQESWLVNEVSATRESDGAQADDAMHKRFLGMIAVAEARAAEVEELSK